MPTKYPSKELCEWSQDELRDHFEKLSKIVAKPKFACTHCGRAAHAKKMALQARKARKRLATPPGLRANGTLLTFFQELASLIARQNALKGRRLQNGRPPAYAESSNRLREGRSRRFAGPF